MWNNWETDNKGRQKTIRASKDYPNCWFCVEGKMIPEEFKNDSFYIHSLFRDEKRKEELTDCIYCKGKGYLEIPSNMNYQEFVRFINKVRGIGKTNAFQVYNEEESQTFLTHEQILTTLRGNNIEL